MKKESGNEKHAYECRRLTVSPDFIKQKKHYMYLSGSSGIGKRGIMT